jgi:hypothetical protein
MIGQSAYLAEAKGYQHQAYAGAFAEFGTPRELEHCGGWVLERPVPGSNAIDAMGCYPIFCCRDWQRIPDDMSELGSRLLTLSLVADPFGNHDPALLRSAFAPVIPFKTHFVADLTVPIRSLVSEHHQYYARKSLRRVSVDVCSTPAQHLDAWTAMFAGLAARHRLKGIKAFSRSSFEKQLSVPGMVMFTAEAEGRLVGIQLWYQQDDVAYGHLAAYSPSGYDIRARASYGMYWAIIQHFASRVRWLDLGGSAGSSGDARDGLAQFKQGWSSGTRTAFLCGRVLNPAAYADIMNTAGVRASDYFPAYRQGEFEPNWPDRVGAGADGVGGNAGRTRKTVWKGQSTSADSRSLSENRPFPAYQMIAAPTLGIRMDRFPCPHPTS